MPLMHQGLRGKNVVLGSYYYFFYLFKKLKTAVVVGGVDNLGNCIQPHEVVYLFLWIPLWISRWNPVNRKNLVH